MREDQYNAHMHDWLKSLLGMKRMSEYPKETVEETVTAIRGEYLAFQRPDWTSFGLVHWSHIDKESLYA